MQPSRQSARIQLAGFEPKKQIYADGGVSLRGVAAKLEDQGYTTPSGERYSVSAIASMLGKGLTRYKATSAI
jgi:hypothetical protein